MKRLLQLFMIAATLAWCVPAHASVPGLSVVGSQTAVGTSLTPPAHHVGDLFIMWSFRNALTAPTLPAGWTSVATASANSSSFRLGCKVATTNAETSGTWTNANDLILVIVRNQTFGTTANCNTVPIKTGTNSTGTATATVTYGAVTFGNSDGSSWAFGFAGHSAATDLSTAPTLMTNRTSVGTSPMVAAHDTNGGVTTWSSTNVTVNATGNYHSTTIEVKSACRIADVTCYIRSAAAVGSGSVTTFATPATAADSNNVMVVWSGGASDTITLDSVTDAAGNTFTHGTSCRITGNTDFIDAYWTVVSSASASDVITAHYSAGLTFTSISVLQYAGTDTSSPFELCSASATGSGTTATSASFAPAAANNANVAYVRNPGGGTSAYTAGTNYILRESSTVTASYADEDRVNAPSGSQTATLTWTTTQNWKIGVASFKVPAAGGTTPTPQMMMTGVGD